MSRELKFRIFNTETKMMIDPHKITQLALAPGFNQDGVFIPFKDRWIIMQFVGVKDEKGRNIYEGDIYFKEVETDEGDVRLYSVMVWLEDRCLFTFLTKGEYVAFEDEAPIYLDESDNYEFSKSDLKHLHYAGNIHEHSHLLS